LQANGVLPVDPKRLTSSDAIAIAKILEFTKRTIPADKWITELRHAANYASFDAFC
jgi:hypothetical protein